MKSSSLDPALAVVINARTVAIGYRRNIRTYPKVPDILGSDPVWAIATAAAMFPDEGVLIVPDLPIPTNVQPFPDGIEWGVDRRPDTERIADFRALLTSRGWSATDASWRQLADAGWLTITGEGLGTVHMGLLVRHLERDREQLLWGDHGRHLGRMSNAEQMAQDLAAFHAATGVAWRGHAGVTFHEMILRPYDLQRARQKSARATRTGPVGKAGYGLLKPALWHLSPDLEKRAAYRRPTRGQGDLIWKTRTDETWTGKKFVHVFDTNKQHLAAFISGEFAYGDLVLHDGQPPFDPAAAGFWQLLIPKGAWWAGGAPAIPPLIDPRRIDRQRHTWACTPVAKQLVEVGAKLHVVKAWLADDGDSRAGRVGGTGRLYRTPGERLRDAITMGAHTEQVRGALKACYTQGRGMMARRGGRIHRDDHAATVEDQARSMLWRKASQAAPILGWPVECRTDSLFYASDDPAPAYASTVLKTGVGIGALRHERTIPMDAYLSERTGA